MSIYLDYLSDRVPKDCIRAILAIDDYQLTNARLMFIIHHYRALPANQYDAIDEIMSVASSLSERDQKESLLISLLACMPGFDEYLELSLNERRYHKAIFLGKYLLAEFYETGMRNIRQSVQRWFSIPRWRASGSMALPYQPKNFAEFSTLIYQMESSENSTEQALQRALVFNTSATSKLVEAFHIDLQIDETPKWLGECLNYPKTGLIVPPPTHATMVSTRNREIMYRGYRDRRDPEGEI